MSRSSLWLSLLLLGCASAKPALPAKSRPLTTRQSDFKFPSGLRVLVDRVEGSPRVVMTAMVEAGSADDPDGREGLAHLVEHLAFRSRHQTKLSMWDRLEYAGAWGFNAFTDFDHTGYVATSRREAAPEVLALLSQILTEPVSDIDPAAFDVEREVVRNELRERDERGGVGAARAALMEALFPAGHRYARAVAGSHGSLRAISYDDAIGFNRRYRPDQITLVMVGDFQIEEIQPLLERALSPRLLGDLTAAPLTVHARVSGGLKEPPASPAPVDRVVDAAIATQELYLAWSLPRALGPEGSAFTGLPQALEILGFDSRDRISGLVGTDAALSTGNELSVLICRLRLTKDANPTQVREEFLERLNKLSDGNRLARYNQGISARHRAQRLLFTSEDLHFLAERELTALHHFGRPASLADVRAELTVSPAAIEDAAQTYVTAERARWVTAVPRRSKPGETKLASTDLRVAESHAVVEYEPQSIERTALGIDPANLREATLANGLQLVVIRNKTAVLSTISVALPSGNLDEPRTAAELAAEFAIPDIRFGKGIFGVDGRWSFTASRDLSVISFYAPNPRLLELLPAAVEHLGSLWVKEASFPPVPPESSEVVLENVMRANLFPGHVWGKPLGLADLKAAGERGAKEWLARVVVPNRAKVVVTSALAPDDVLSGAMAAFSQWKRGEDRFTPTAPPAESAGMRPPILVPSNGASQVTARIACRLPAPSGIDGMLTHQILASALERRLTDTLRMKQGATYGVRSILEESRLDAQILYLETSIGSSQAATTIPELRATLAQLSDSLWEDGAIARARWEVARETMGRARTSFEQSHQVAMAMIRGAKPRDIAELPAHLARLPNRAVDDAWERCRNSLVLLLVGDPSDLRSAGK